MTKQTQVPEDQIIDLGRSVTLKNPLVYASGTFGLGDKLPDIYQHAGAFVSKTVTPEPRAGNPPPRIVETPSGIVNYVGLQNPGIDGYVEMLRGLSFPTVFLSSVYAVNIDDVTMMLEKLESVPGIEGYELNLSCPNVKTRSVLPSVDPKMVEDIVATAREATDKWICAKLPPYSCIEVASIAEDQGADAVCVSNTYPSIAFNPAGTKIMGGLSGPCIKPMTLYNVHQVSQRVSIPVVASGGVCNGRDVKEFLSVGATAVQLGSINFIEPQAVLRILEEWRQLDS